MERTKTIALVGNPNCGKSTLFNRLTGLNQKIGNFPGVTVEKKVGAIRWSNGEQAQLMDLPGTYSLYPKSQDEQVVFEVLCNPSHFYHPDYCMIVIDASNIRRGMLLASQVIDLQIPSVILLNQMEGKEAVNLDPDTLSQDIGLPVIAFNARKADAQTEFFKSLSESDFGVVEKQIINMKDVNPTVFEKLEELVPAKNHYDRIQQAAGHHRFSKGPLDAETEAEIHKILVENKFHKVRFEATETLRRYKWVDAVLSRYQLDLEPKPLDFNSKLDKILTHKIWGYTIFLGIMFLLFQAIFAWSSLPMEWIEQAFSFLGEKLSAVLPEGKIQDLIVDGLLAGLSGVLIFIPQIAFLFLFIGILEETGYMARVSFIMDRILKRYGLNGKSVVPLISGIACAVPAIMAARTIQNSRERLLTILVTPLMSCSARLPVYTLLISLVIPAKTIAGLQLQGLVLMAFYLLGFLAAIGVSWVFKQILKTKERSYFIMELPDYKLPDWRSVGLTHLRQGKSVRY